MALTERSRSALYQGLTNVVDEEAVQEMLSYFPARDVEEPVTEEFLRAEIADLRTEMAAMEIRIVDRMDAKLDRTLRLSLWTNVGSIAAVAGIVLAAVRL